MVIEWTFRITRLINLERLLGVRRGRWLFIFTFAIGASIFLLHTFLVESFTLTRESQLTLYINDEVVAPVSGRILATGGGGNIGKHLIRRVVSSGVPVTCIDVLIFEDELQQLDWDVPDSRELLRVIHGDVRDEAALDSALTLDVVGVINLAAVSRVLWCLENEDDCEDINVRAVDVMLEAMKQGGHKPWIIQASSREVYGSQDTMPVKEDAPITPANVYGGSKARAEKVIERHVSDRKSDGRGTPLQAIALRLANVYGGEYDHRERLVPSIITQAMAHRTIQIVGGSQNGQFEAFNVASGASISVHELLGKIIGITQSASPLQTISGDNRFPDRYLGDTTKSSDVLNFTARVSIDEGIHRLATAYLRQMVDYLERKVEDKCARKQYTVEDLLKLNGCSGTIATNGPEQTGYLYFSDGKLGWRDDLEPRIWSFEADNTSDEAPIFQFRSGAQHFEILEDGQARGEGESRYKLVLDPATGHVRMLAASTGRPVLNSNGEGKAPRLFRLTPFCCADKEGPWPFFDEDPLISAVLDLHLQQSHDFAASRPKTLCTRLKSAMQTAQKRLDRLASFDRPIKLQKAPLPTGLPAQWRLRDLPTCANLCDHPTICIDTGDCMCAQSACPSTSRFPFASTANLPVLSYPPPTFGENNMLDPDVLNDQVSRSSWLNVLRPHAARYLGRSPSFIRINLTRLPDDIQNDRDQNPEIYDRLRSSPYGCFSADSALERGVKIVSDECSNDSLVFFPYYQAIFHERGQPHIDNWLDDVCQHHLPPDFDESNLIIPFTKDWGACNFWERDLFTMREHSGAGVTRAVRQGTAWSVMGHLNVNCYRPEQDIVIPSLTCLQDQLREHFRDVGHVRPIRQRTKLAAFKEPEGDHYLVTLNDYHATVEDYLATLNDTVFCPLPPGITGWATRTIDVIYSGCIQVLIGDQTHHPFWDMLDWSKFSVHISEGELDHLEEILLGYTWSCKPTSCWFATPSFNPPKAIWINIFG